MTPAAQKISQLILAGVSSSGITAQAERLGMTAETVVDAIAEAKRAITLAADYNRDEQIGIAFARINNIYSISADSDLKTALAAQKELNKLLSLYSGSASPDAGNAAGGNEAAQELERVAQHLHPLKLAKPDYPISGHARLAAAKIRDAEK